MKQLFVVKLRNGEVFCNYFSANRYGEITPKEIEVIGGGIVGVWNVKNQTLSGGVESAFKRILSEVKEVK